MKVTTEKLPKSLLALDIELDSAQVEKGLDKAARRLSQKANIPGFRKGKAPRFIIENYFGRGVLYEEATDDLVNTAYRAALDQAQVEPVGRPTLERVDYDPFRFRVTVPVAATVTLPDYRAIQVPLEVEPVTDALVQARLEALREKHVVLKEPEEPRPAREGDQLTIRMTTIVDGAVIDAPPEGQEPGDEKLVLERERLIDGLFEGLVGMQVGDEREIQAHAPADHLNEQVRDKDVTFKVHLVGLQDRIVPEWDELPVLEEYDGDLDGLRAKVRADLETQARQQSERAVIDQYIEELVAKTEYDIADAQVEELADRMLHEQAEQFERYGIKLDQVLQYRGQTHDEAVAALVPQAGERLKRSLALAEVLRAEGLQASEDEIEGEIARAIGDSDEATRGMLEKALRGEYIGSIITMVLDRKIRARLLEIATGTAPALSATPDEPAVAAPQPAPEAAPATDPE